MNHLESERDYNRLCMNNFGKIIILVFHAKWHDHSNDYLQGMTTLYEISQLDPNDILFAHLDADLVPEVAKRYNINSVPSVIFTDAQKGELKKYENESPALIFDEIEEFIKDYKIKFEQKRVVMYEKIEKLIQESDVLIFIKGTATDPECKFTRQFLEIMKDLDCKFTYYDIIADNDMRHWLRQYNQWPTYPQLYIDAELIGGLDKCKQRIKEGYVQQRIPKSAKIHDPAQRLKKITAENKVILFTQGPVTSETLDSNHKLMIDTLKYGGIKFNCFDVTTDEILQQYLVEKFGQVPQLFADSKHVGNASQVDQLSQQQQLLSKIPGSEWELDGEQKLKFLLNNCPIITFIHGIPKETHSEDSQKMINILKKLDIIYEFYNVDADTEVLQNLSKISQYDKIPQLYIKGKLIGGIDTTEKLFQDGDLQELVKQQ